MRVSRERVAELEGTMEAMDRRMQETQRECMELKSKQIDWEAK